MGKILGKHAPLKMLGKYKLKFKIKPGLPLLSKNLFLVRSNYVEISLIKKDLTQKTELHIKCKSYRNMLSTLMKKSKQNYFTTFFENKLILKILKKASKV